MKPLDELCVRLFCLPGRREELQGDLVELRSDPRRGFLARPRDLLSVCLFQSRLFGWGAREWSRVGLVGVALAVILGTGPTGAVRAQGPYTINARDAAGVFTLELDRGRVLSATMDGMPFPLERIERSGDQLLLATDNPARDLSIHLRPDGGIAWEGRDGRTSADEEEAPIELDWAREYLEEARQAGVREGGELWGVDLYGPLLLADRETRFVVANIADDEGLLAERDGLWVGELPPDQNIANTAIEWAGRRWTMVVWPLPSDRYSRQQLVFHELFHRVQPDLEIPSEDVLNDHLGTRDGRIWLRLEWRALAEALVRQGEERQRAIADALAFRARRQALFPGAAASERSLELNEGLSEYTGLVMSGLPGRVLADRAAVELGRREQMESYTRSFAYASGPAYGVLLDEVGADWRRNLDRSSDLAALLAKATGVEVTSAGAESRVGPYAGPQVIAQEERRADRIAAREAELEALLVDGSTLTVPVTASFRYSFDPNAATPLPGHGTVYDEARITDAWGVLEVSSGGVLLMRPERAIVSVVVPLDPDGPSPPTEGAGWVLDLGEDWHLVPAARPGSWVAAPHN